MKINPIQTVNFRSYNKLNPQTGLSASTSFYSDYPVLSKAVKIIEEKFPKGTDILVYAGSNGEEAFSINTLLRHSERYNIFSLDTYNEAIEYAKRGIYGVHPLADDGFLLKNNNPGHERYLSRIFHKNFKEITKPKQDIDNLEDFIYTVKLGGEEDLFPQKFFIPKPAIRHNVEILEGDINNIDSFPAAKNKKAGAIFFRNALYQLTKNDLRGVMQYGDLPDLNLNKQDVLDRLIDKIYNKLAPGGIFVMGTHLQEHLYIADKSVPLIDTVLADSKRNIRYITYPPHIRSLKREGRFKPLFDFEISGLGNNIKLPLIWQKVK